MIVLALSSSLSKFSYLNLSILYSTRVLMRGPNYTMTVLSSKKILNEKNTTDINSITSLTLTHKALSDVSCLSEFKNLERLDLGFNNLTSLEGLKSCVNLKWLSVAQNKLQSLKGIEGLTKLTVLNAGKNKLKSMDEVKSISSLRALILNDNEITAVCKLDQMKEMNTIVLSRNPISSFGESFGKLKSVTKLSLSNCKLQTIDSSLKYCTELKELRLAHNEIMTIPSEVARLVKLQNLDLGNNSIISWSDIKVLSSLISLKNLNLQGNPVAEKENLPRKVKVLLPHLNIFNSRPIDKIITKEVEDSPVKSGSIARPSNKSSDSHLNDGSLGSKHKREENDENSTLSEKRKKKLKLAQNENGIRNDSETPKKNPEEVKISKHKKEKKNKLIKENPFDVKLDAVITDEKPDKKSKKNIKINDSSAIDNAETSFADLFGSGASENSLEKGDNESDRRTALDVGSAMVTYPSKKKKKRNRVVDPASLESSQVDEIGLGGVSAWE